MAKRIVLALIRVAGHLWSLPNTVIGALFGIGGHFRFDAAHRVWESRGGWAANLSRRLGYGAMAIGDVVLSPPHGLSPVIYRHELVHATQARLFGPLYVPLTLLGYALGLLLCPANPHDGSPLEIWADVASGNANGNAYLAARRRKKQAP